MGDPAAAQACRHVWINVVLQAARDLFPDPQRKPSTETRHAKRNAIAAEHWLGSRDFHKICSLAGLDGSRVETALRNRLQDYYCGRFNRGLFRPNGGAAQHHPQKAAQDD